MRFVLLTLILSLGMHMDVQAQSLSDLKFPLPSLEKRYDMDYHIEGLYKPSADTLAGLDLDQYESFREEHNDVYIFDPATGFHIQLFSINKALENYMYRFKNDPDE